MKDLDISNIESKPTVVLVINQSEFDQLMRHLEKEGYVWNSGQKPTEWRATRREFPFGIALIEKRLMTTDLVMGSTTFPDYAAKHIFPHLQEYTKEEVEAIRSHVYEPLKIKPDVKPKRPYPNRVVKSKYDKVVFELKMAQTALDNRNKDVDGWIKKINELVAERDRLKAENTELKERNSFLATWWADHNKKIVHELNEANDQLESKATEHAQLDTLARKLRDQRDMARFLAAMFFLAAVGFAVAVWVGRLVPVY